MRLFLKSTRLVNTPRTPLVLLALSSFTSKYYSSAFTNQSHSIKFTPRLCSSSSSSTMSTSASASAINDASSSSSAWWKEEESHRHRRQQALQKCMIPLSPTSYKGSSGRVGVLGGSARYTGAPYYAAMAALKAGADLAFVFCAKEAAQPIKGYSPELMVAPVYSAETYDRLVRAGETKSDEAERAIQKMVEEVTSLMDKLHVLVIGPGLGRCPLVMEATSRIVKQAQAQQVPLVLDADALFLLTMEPYQQLLTNASPVVLTPNVMERKRLQGLEKYWKDHAVVIEKGEFDVIHFTTTINSSSSSSSSNFSTMTCEEVGGLKRSGGLGDILAGTLGTLVAWNNILTKQGVASADDLPLACWTACSFVKSSTHQAFLQHRRAMTAPDVLAELGPTIDQMTTPTRTNIL